MYSDDRPITANDQDLFAYNQIARRLGDAIQGMQSGIGLTIGIEGKWGAGKTSLTNLLIESLRVRSSSKIRVFKFSPWLFPSSASYPGEFLKTLAAEIDKAPVKTTATEKSFGGITHWFRGLSKTKVLSLGDKIREYAALILGFAGTILKKSESLPHFAVTGRAAEMGANLLSSLRLTESADAQKANIITELSRSAYKYVVVMDDLDRLEPLEALEVIRLVRSIADFPNVVYVLCYDRQTLATAIKTGLSIKDGNAYLEKIIQLSFVLPRPEPFDLRDWCLSELAKVYSYTVRRDLDADLRARLQQALDFYADQLVTPRQVRRLINAVAFHFAPVSPDVDFVDLCWLHAAKLFVPKLYDWVAAYLPEMALILSANFRASDDEHRTYTKNLENLMIEAGWRTSGQHYRLSNYLPGISLSLKQDVPLRLFGEIRKDVLAALERGRRLASPAHFRFYFAFSPPRDAMTDGEFTGILDLLSGDPLNVEQKFIELAKRKRTVGGDWLAYLFDRLRRFDLDDLSVHQLRNLAIATANTMDRVAGRNMRRTPFGRQTAYELATSIVLNTLKRLKQLDAGVFDAGLLAVGHGLAIGWLVEDLIAKELRDHGLVGDRPVQERALTEEDLLKLKGVISSRLNTLESRALLRDAPELTSTLYRWKEMDDGDFMRPREWLAELIASDEGLIETLLRMRSWRSSMGSVEYPLHRKQVAAFMNWDDMLERVKAIVQETEQRPALAKDASQVLLAIDLDDDEVFP